MIPDFGSFIVWPAAAHLQDRVLSVLAGRFEIRGVHRISWSPALVPENFGRFYASSRLTPPFPTYFQRQKGRGPFTLVTVVDRAPVHEPRPTNRGRRLVNAAFFDMKCELRGLTPLPMVIHCAETAREALRDLYLILGLTPQQYLERYPAPWTGRIEMLRRDLSGAVSWASLRDVFDALNQLVEYVLLRDSDDLPGEGATGAHGAIELLVDDYPEAVRVLNARPCYGVVPKAGGRFYVTVAHERVPFELRFVGDDYFDRAWQEEVLERRRRTTSGIFTPCERDLVETLAYHALVHRRELPEDHARYLVRVAAAAGLTGWTPAGLGNGRAQQLLDEIVGARGRRHVRPRDATLFYNFAATGWTLPRARLALASLRRAALIAWWRCQAPIDLTVRRVRQQIGQRLPGPGHFSSPYPQPERPARHEERKAPGTGGRGGHPVAQRDPDGARVVGAGHSPDRDRRQSG